MPVIIAEIAIAVKQNRKDAEKLFALAVIHLRFQKVALGCPPLGVLHDLSGARSARIRVPDENKQGTGWLQSSW